MTKKEDPIAERQCLRVPVPEIFDAARYLDAAVAAHLAGKVALADELIRLADMPAITVWTESLWGKGGPWSRRLPVENAPPYVPKAERTAKRMPGKAQLRELLQRDGFHCRFCGIPVVRSGTRSLIRKVYPAALRWGDHNRNAEQHAGLQAMWLTYDHILPYSRGGTSDLDNMVVACQPCNCGRTELTLQEVGLQDPRQREPIQTLWDGLERFK